MQDAATPPVVRTPVVGTRVVGTPARPARGRPRDPGLEARVFDAAVALYAEAGWPGFHFDAVARGAGVGKAALYRRWGTRGALLRATLEARWYAVAQIDTGSLRGDLLALARMCFDKLTGPYGRVALHLHADAERFGEMRASTGPWGETVVRQSRLMVRRAIERGEIPGGVNRGLIIDAVVGGVTNHVAATPERLRPAMLTQAEGFLDELVALVVRGVRG